MLHGALVLASLLPLVSRAGAPSSDPCRRPHCTLEGEDLPLVLLLADTDFFSEERLRVAPGIELEVPEATRFLMDRHRHGHGGWPKAESPATLAQLGKGDCDPRALDALQVVAYSALGHELNAMIDASDIAMLLERNGRVDEAGRLLKAAIPAGAEPGHGTAWRDYARFLVRRGKFEEALPLIESYEPPPGCGLGMQLDALDTFDWVESCCRGMYGGTCDDTLYEKRLTIAGIDGLADYMAQRELERGSAFPEQEARSSFESMIRGLRVPAETRENWREQFRVDLAEWRAARNAPPGETFDWTKPLDVDRAVARALSLAHSDPSSAYSLLFSAAETGLPVAGHAVRALRDDPVWGEASCEILLAVWRDRLLARTFGCADPEDPATW